MNLQPLPAKESFHSRLVHSLVTLLMMACGPVHAEPGTSVSGAARALLTATSPKVGTVVAWGDNSYGQTAVLAGLTDVTAIASGVAHNLALKRDGTVVAWGLNNHSQVSVPFGLSRVVAIAAGGWHSLALKSDGTVAAWGQFSSGETAVPEGLNGVIAIAAGGNHPKSGS